MNAVVRELTKQSVGRVFEPGDAEYEAAVRIFNSAIEDRPAAVLQCRSAVAVAAGVKISRKLGLPVSVRGGGHNAAGLALRANGGILLDCSRWRDTYVDPTARLASCAPGTTWGDYDSVTQGYGLGSPGGVVSTTGVAGLTLSGGIGAMRGEHGLACDNLAEVQVVLADGSIVSADERSEPDLFWAVRGGGSNFGIVTQFKFRVSPATRVVSGFLSYPIEEAPKIFEAYKNILDEIPASCAIEFMLQGLERGQPMLRVTPRYIGTMAEAGPFIDKLRSFGKPQDTLREMSYCESQRFLDPGSIWGFRSLWRTQTLRRFELPALSELARAVKEAPSPLSMVVIEILGAAVGRVDTHATAVGFRGATLNLMMVGQWHKAKDDEINSTWIKDLGRKMRSYEDSGAYPNYLPQDATVDDVIRAHGTANYARLQKVKLSYDPQNSFRCNQNIIPSKAS